MSVFHPVDADSLTEQQKDEAIKLLMFLKEKGDNSIKGRGCADGQMQKNKYKKKEVVSPTVATESVLMTAAIEAKENRDVAVVDIPGAFLQADIDEEVWMALDETLAELMCKVNLKIRNNRKARKKDIVC